jgi:5'-nucleotidase
LTNDDGIRAKGLRALVEIARPFGRLIVVAPEESQSGQSHALTNKHPLRVRTVADYGDGVEAAYACNGTPADCVKLAVTNLLRARPDVVLSGINHGANSSASVLYSGTVAAAQEGALYGSLAAAFSLLDVGDNADFSHCIKYGQRIVKTLLAQGLTTEVFLNVNVPNIPEAQIKGIKVARQAHGMWAERYDKRVDPEGRDYYWLTGDFVNYEPDATDTDEWALAQNYIAVTPIQADMTCYSAMDKLIIDYE